LTSGRDGAWTWCSRPRAIRLVEAGAADLEKLVTHSYSLEEAAAGFKLVHAYAEGVIKAVVVFEE